MSAEKRTPGGHRANEGHSAGTAQANNNTLAEALEAHSLTPPDHIEPGRIHRIPGAGKPPSNRAGWCKVFEDGHGAVFGDWSTGLQETWQARKPKDANELARWRAMAEQAQAEAAAQRHQKAAKAAQSALDTWTQATAPDGLHGYLVSKQVNPHGIRQDGEDLIIPVYVNGELSSLQRIDTAGNKQFMAGGKIKAGFHLIGDPADTIIIVEGFATGASIHEATGHAAAVAFNCGNLKPAAQAIRAKYPDAQIVIAADDDRNTAGNPGITKAREAAQAVNALLATPGQAGDFNDLHAAQGADKVRERIEAAEPIKRRGFSLVPASSLQFKDPEYLIDGLIERDSLAICFGPPETWKSLFTIDALCSIETGTVFHGRQVKQGRAAYICGEGFNGIARRLEAWNRKHGIAKADNNMLISTQAAALNDETLLAGVLAELEKHKPDVVAIDTLARNFGPGDENATSDMQSFIRACDRIREINGCAVILVHHSGHMDKSRARGNSALKGAADWEFQFERRNETVEITCTKSKDAERPEPQAFALDIIELKPGVTSVTLKKAAREIAPANTPKGKHQKAALAMLENLLDLHRENLKAGGHDPASAKVQLNDWRDACVKDGMPRSRWYDAKRTLQDAEEIQVTIGGFVQLSGCPPL